MSDVKIKALRDDLEKAVVGARKEHDAAQKQFDTTAARVRKDIAEAQAQRDEASTKKAEVEAQLAKFNQVFGGEALPTRKKPGPKPKAKAAAVVAAPAERKKPGPKPGAKKIKMKPGPKPGAKAAAAAASKPGPKAKPGPKPKKVSAKASAKKTGAKPGPKPAASKRAAAGREAVKAGLRPPIKDAMAQVMGEEVLNADTIFERLEKKEWLPNAKKPRAYIGYLLSATKERFESVPTKGRGFYRVKDKTSKANGGGKKTEETKAATVPAKVETKASEPKVAAAEKATTSADDVLAELGMSSAEASASFG
jgi:hypothetical protein